MHYYEVEFGTGDENTAMWMCIKGERQPSIEEASHFLKKDAEMFGMPVHGIYPIDEITARASYDFSNAANWPVFGSNHDEKPNRA